MIDVIKPVYQALQADVTLAAIVGNDIYAQGDNHAVTTPCVTYFLITNPAEYVWGSSTSISEAYSDPSIQISVYAETSTTVMAIITAIDAIMVVLCYRRTFQDSGYDTEIQAQRAVLRYESIQL